jgi:hypothetical protein
MSLLSVSVALLLSAAASLALMPALFPPLPNVSAELTGSIMTSCEGYLELNRALGGADALRSFLHDPKCGPLLVGD